jgi:uncharacterized protein YfaS (alpha-2-macroglobulin family)
MFSFRSRLLLRRTLALAAMCAGLPAVAATTLVDFGPVGTTRDVRQIRMRFSDDMTALGNDRAGDPAAVSCGDPDLKAVGHWIDPRNWVGEFAVALPDGVACTVRPLAAADLKGQAVAMPAPWRFDTGGPRAQIEYFPSPLKQEAALEEPVALFVPSAAVDPASLRHLSCSVNGTARPVTVLSSGEAQAYIDRWIAGRPRTPVKPVVQPWLAARCGDKPWPNGAGVTWVWGKGIRSSHGVAHAVDQTFHLRVRPALSVAVQCTGMTGTEGCDPRGPLTLEFSEKMATPGEHDIVVAGSSGRRYPVKAVRFGPNDLHRFETTEPMAEGERLVPVIERTMTDVTGRTIARLTPKILPLVASRLPAYAAMVRQQGVVPWKPGQEVRWPLALRNTEPRVQVRRWHLDSTRDRVDTLLALHRRAVLGTLKTVDDAPRARPFERSASLLEELGAGGTVAHVDQEVIPSGRAMEFAALPLSGYGTWLVEVDSPRYRARVAHETKAIKDRYTVYDNPRQWDSGRLALVQLTNLRIHARLSDRYTSLIWITAIDSAVPQAGADVDVFDCDGRRLFAGRTDDQGRVPIGRPLAPAQCKDASDGLWIVARHGADATVLQYRGDLPRTQPDRLIVHTVLDRTLLSAGETVSMQTLARVPVATGYAIPAPQTGKLRIADARGETVHEADLSFDARGSALHQWRIPASARLGTYVFTILDENRKELGRGSFQVEEFRLPAFEARLDGTVSGEGRAPVVALAGRLAFLSGGSAARQPILVKGSYRAGAPAPVPGYDFQDRELTPADPPPFAPREAVLDGAGRYEGKVEAPLADTPLTLHAEMEFSDPSGETQVQSADVPVWPREHKVGLSVRRGLVQDSGEFSVIVLDGANRPLSGQEVRIDAALASYRPLRYPLVRAEPGERIPVCTVRTDVQGKAQCTVPWTRTTENLWLFRAEAQGASRAAVAVHDGYFRWGNGAAAIERVGAADPEAGRPVTLRLRSPFLPATVLLTVEREGVLASHVLTVTAPDQQIEIPTDHGFAPGVRVIAQFVRAAGDAPGDVDPEAQLEHGATLDLHFARASHQLDVDVRLDRPAARPGDTVQARVTVSHHGVKAAGARVTLIAVDDALNLLKPNPTWSLLGAFWRDRYIPMTAARSMLTWPRTFTFGPMPRYWPMREAALRWNNMAVRAELDGQSVAPAPAAPAPAVTVTVSGARATEQSSMARKKNAATAMDSIVAEDVGGLANFSMDAFASAAPRSNFSSLALWKADVQLDGDGRATVAIPLPDSLTRWRIVAVAMAGTDMYGAGSATVQTRKQLQVRSGLPPVVRGGDLLTQKITLRNDGDEAMTVKVRAEGRPATDGAQPANATASAALQFERSLDLAAHESKTLPWSVRIPQAAGRIEWKIAARADKGSESDALAVTQRVVGMPVTVRDSALLHVDRTRSVPVAMPTDALPGLGGINVRWTDSLGAGAVAGAQTWMALYPYRCMEQMLSMAVVSGDAAAWRAAMDLLPKYLDDRGLVQYFPNMAGSEMLTAYVLDIAAATGLPLPQAERERMRAALRDALAQPKPYSWLADDDVLNYRLALQAALGTDLGKARPVVPADLNALPTIALLDWVRYVLATADGPLRRSRLESAANSLRNRYDLQGTRLRWRSDGRQQSWWMMWTGDVAAARTALLVQQWARVDRRWEDDLPRLIAALVDLQKNGHWNTTVANAWGVAALRQFDNRAGAGPVAGVAVAALVGRSVERAWPDPAPVLLPWPGGGGNATLQLEHKGSGAPWATVQVEAAMNGKEAIAHGLAVSKTITPVQQRVSGRWSEGDVMQVSLHITSHGDNGWLAISDPIPSGATILGKGLGGESALAQKAGEEAKASWWSRPSYIERGSDSYRAYYERVRAGDWTHTYTVRLNNAGTFQFPATRVEAMYAPEIFAEAPNAKLEVAP